MAYEFKRNTTPFAYTLDGKPMIRVPQGMTPEEMLLWANGITSTEQVKGINSYYEMIKEQNVNYSYVPTTQDDRNVPVPGRKRRK